MDTLANGKGRLASRIVRAGWDKQDLEFWEASWGWILMMLTRESGENRTLGEDATGRRTDGLTCKLGLAI